MARVVGVGLLASAFAPLVLIVAVLRVRELGLWGWILIGLSIVAMLLLVTVLRTAARIQAHTAQTRAVRRADERVLGFTGSYLVPAVVVLFGGKDWVTAVATAVLVLLLAVIYVRGGLYHLNPVLALAGFRLYEVTEENGRVTMLLSRKNHLPQSGVVTYRRLGGDAAIQLRGDQ
jgi:hypothetical protein